MKRLERACPSACGVDARGLLAFFEAADALDCHSIMVLRHGKVIAEGSWLPYRLEYNHIAYSVSKSFTSTAIGFCVQEGLLRVDDLVLDFFPDVLPSGPCEQMKRMRVRHLLSMSTGHKTERKAFNDDEPWLYGFLGSYVDGEPGERFCYNSGSTYVLSCIVRAVTGQNVFDYLKPRLFEPMGFSERIWWEQSPQGINTCFNGFNCTCEDFAKLGQLYLNGGVWEGRQLLAREWVEQASALQIGNADNGSNQALGYRQGFGEFSADYCSGYGYLFWHCAQRGAYRGDGIYGQLCVVMPEQDMVVAVQAGCKEPDKILEAMWAHLVPAVDGETSCEADERLAARLCELALAMPQGAAHSEEASRISGVCYRFAQNGLGIQSIQFAFGERDFIEIVTSDGLFCAQIGYGQWVETDTGYDRDGFSCDNKFFYCDAACAGAWEPDGSLMLRLAYTRTPFVDQMRLRFHADSVSVDFWHTVKLYQMRHQLIGVDERALAR